MSMIDKVRIIGAITILMVCGFIAMAHAESIPKDKFVDAVIGEAESGGYTVMLWCSCVIRNRGSLRGVYGARSRRVREHLYGVKTFVDAVRAYEDSKYHDVTGGCRHWFSDADLKQDRVRYIIRREKLVFVKNVGGNNFYKKACRSN